MERPRVLLVFGTRPEAIKMAPVYKALAACDGEWQTLLCVTAQHRQMLDQTLGFFGMQPDYDLDVMQPGQTLVGLSARVLTGMQTVLDHARPDLVLVHGDTTTSTMSALVTFYNQIPVGHVEAGLRTYDLTAPFPEEANRQLTGRLTRLHFAPTTTAAAHLAKEGVPAEQIYTTGNTVIDALLYAVERVREHPPARAIELLSQMDTGLPLILVTGHRRENFGQGFEDICLALRDIAAQGPAQILYPVHLNPNVQEPVQRVLAGAPNVHLCEPLAYEDFVYLMDKAYMLLTDSGGIQEEAPSLGKPVLVMREVTERPEAVEAGTVLLCGTDRGRLSAAALRLLHDREAYGAMSHAHNPYGDGQASGRIVEAIRGWFAAR